MTSAATMTVETITPDDARMILERNTRNRTPSKHGIEKLTAAMKAGAFQLTYDPIRIGIDGTLYDGQHRLKACIAAGVPFTTAIVRNIEEHTLLVLDSGIKRSRQQQLEIAAGISSHITDTALMLLRMGIGPRYDLIDSDTVLAILAKHPAIAETADAYREAAKLKLGANLAAGELILRAHGHQAEAAAWRAVWIDGAPSELGAAAHELRQTLIKVLDNDDTRHSARRLWTTTNRRKALAWTLLRTAAHLPAVKTHRAEIAGEPVLFPGLSAERLMTVVDFATTDKTPATAISTALPNSIISARSRSKNQHAADADADTTLPGFTVPTSSSSTSTTTP